MDRIQQVFARSDTDIQVAIDELIVSGDLAYARGSFQVTLTSRSSQETKTLQQRYIEVWRNEEGVWRVTRTINNEPS